MDFNEAFKEMKQGEKLFLLTDDPTSETALYRVIWREDVWRGVKDGGYVFQRKGYKTTPWMDFNVDRYHLNGNWEVADAVL